jgi:adenylyl- and sulfurtransferase ThiI
MTKKTKKWLLWGGLGVAAYMLIKRGREKKAVEAVVKNEIAKNAATTATSQGDYIQIG